jgi:hypothetical protein
MNTLRSIAGLFLTSFLSMNSTWAYSQFIGFGYSSCITCHFNSSGNGPLNDYGRALAATEISGRLFGPDDDEQAAKQSGFLGSIDLPWWWRPSIGYRGLNYQQSISRSPQSRFINMQADLANVFRFDENDRIVVVTNIGYAPIPRNVSSDIPQADKNFISREHYVRLDATENLRFYVGLTDKAYGIRIPDHEAYSRRYTYNGQNDQVHGVTLNYNNLPVDFTLQGFAGNLQQQDATVRHKGAATTFEYEVAEKSRVGLSAQWIKNNYVEMLASSFLTRLGVGQGSALLWETGAIRVKPVSGATQTGLYTYFQPTMRLSRGLFFTSTAEYYTSDVSEDRTRYLRFGPGFQYFPMQRFEFRLDTWNERSFTPQTVSKETWSLLGQVHVWL